MTINEAITRLDSLIFNTYSNDDKVQWLSRLDLSLKRLIFDTHEGANCGHFSGYTEYTPDNMVLLVPAPFDDIYLRWMEAQIHYHNGEYDKYNSAIILYNAAYEAFAKFYNRTHMPIQKSKRFKF